MSKRYTGLGIGKRKKSTSHKTKKRLAIKHERLAALAARRGGKKKGK